MAHIAAGRMILMRQNDNKNVPTEKLAVRKHNILAQEAMANFKYKPNPVDPQNPVQPRKGLRLESNGGYINKIRMDSVSGKPKEAKKVPLIRTHSKVFFKPAAGRKKSVAEKKFTVDVPDHVAHDMSPMDVDSPLVMIRNKMTKKPIHVQDIDAINDPLKSSVYAQDIIEYLQAVERRSIFPSNFLLEKNREVTPHVRTVLMDWLIQVQNHQELSQFTLHLCANLIDKFLARQRVLLNVVQLVGITALLLAAKYYERFPPDIADLCRLTDDTYVPDQVLKMERCMLRKLDFDLNMPGPIVFVERFLMVNDCENKHLIESMSVFLLDLTLTELNYVHFCPSMLAASAIYVARGLLACAELWNPSFVHYTKYTEKDLDECVRMIRKSLSKLGKSKFQGARTKFAHHSYHGISKHHSVLTAINLWPEEENDVFECEGTLV